MQVVALSFLLANLIYENLELYVITRPQFKILTRLLQYCYCQLMAMAIVVFLQEILALPAQQSIVKPSRPVVSKVHCL